MHIPKATCGIYTFAATCLLLSACADDILTDKLLTDDEIAFRASVSDRPSGRTSRSGAAGGVEYLEPEAVTSDIDRTLYVHTLVNEDYFGQTQSRAAQIKEADFSAFSVSAYAYDGGWTEPAATGLPNLIRNAGVSRQDGGSLWVTANKHFWPAAEERVRFLAYANLPDGIAPSASFTQLDYTVNKDVTKQNDIIAAVSDVTTAEYRKSGQPVEMRFRHILTGIRFRTAKGDNALEGYKIKKVGFENIRSRGVFTLGEFSDDATADREAMWVLNSSATSLSYFSVNFGDGIDAESDIAINDDNHTLMMLPQELHNDARLVVTLVNKDGREHQLVKTLSGADWGMGQMITYIISSNAVLVEDVFELYEVKRQVATGPVIKETLLSDNHTYEAPYYDYNLYDESQVSMTSHYLIRSYRREYPKYVDGESVGECRIIPLDYTKVGDADWIRTGINTHPANDPTPGGTYYDMVVDAQQMSQRDPWNDLLKNRTAAEVMPSWSLDNGYYDLSKRYSKNNDGMTAEINTSNCYIVSAPGKYKFPVVYGNIIRHSRINYESFGGFRKPGKDEDGKDIDGTKPSHYEFVEPNTFVNSKGEVISTLKDVNGGDFISPQVSGATQARLIWADYREIVNDMSATLSAYPNVPGAEHDEKVTIDGAGDLYIKYVYFELKPENIQQGNMMLGFSSGTSGQNINWSWHIWITPFVPNNYNDMNDKANETLDDADKILPTPKYSSSGQEFSLIPYNLGWCHRVYLTFGSGDRDCSYTFTQAETGKVITLKVQQPKAEDIQYGNNLLFQWGRKDPLRGSYNFKTGSFVLKPFYHLVNGKVEQFIITPNKKTVSVAEVLKAPYYVYGTSPDFTDWCNTPSNYLWRIPEAAKPGEEYTRETDGKTIYDPSPVGHLIAGSDAFDAFLSTNTKIELPVFGFKKGDVYVPLCGYRGQDGLLYGGGTDAYYQASDVGGLLHFNINSDAADKQALNRVISGAVRPRRSRHFVW